MNDKQQESPEFSSKRGELVPRNLSGLWESKLSQLQKSANPAMLYC